jgi:hypothetical protein
MNETADVRMVRETEDGSAVFEFDFSPDAVRALVRLGIITAIKAGLDEAKKFHPDYEAEKDT